MKRDLDQKMNDQDIDAIWVTGNLFNNPDMVYFTGIHHVNNADLFKIQGKDPVLFFSVDMESEEAANSGLETHAYFSHQPFSAYIKKNNGDLVKAYSERIQEALHSIGLLSGRVAISGTIEIGQRYALLKQLEALLPDIDFFSGFKDSAISKARYSKSSDEIAHIKQIGSITTEVVGRVQGFLQTQQTYNDHLVFSDGSPVKIKDVKSRIRKWLAELDADNPEGTIFAIGKDVGMPHSSGNPEDIIMLGKPIIFDIFPCETGGGYFYDFTRTWCLDYASDEAALLYEQVLSVHHQIIKELSPGDHFRKYQERTCELFAEMGHVTVAENETTTTGYRHSVGHGLGLNVHEKPFCGSTAAPDDILEPGVVFTIEPGLYYAEKEMGARVEDTLYLNKEGIFSIVADYPYDFVLPIKK